MNVKQMKKTDNENEQILIDFFTSGIKNKNAGLLGVELEHFVVNKKAGHTVAYHGNEGVEGLLNDISVFYDEKIYSEQHLIALRRQHILVSLEPAGQLEVSIGEFFDLNCFEFEYKRFLDEITPALDKRGLKLATEGYHPLTKASEIPLLPKERYRLMDDYFKSSGTTGLYMMRGTAATHVAIDYFSELDFVNKFRLANLLAPLFIHLTDNSKTFEGKKNYRKMLRHWIWADVDGDRCNVAKNINCFLDYANYIYNCPPIFMPTKTSVVYTKNTPLKQITNGKELSLEETMHALSMVFPYVRLKNFIEIRTADSMPIEYVLSYLALIKGIFYQPFAIQKLLKTFSKVNDDDICLASENLTEYGYDAKVYGIDVVSLYKELFELAENELSIDENKHLKLLKNLSENKKIIAEVC